MILSRSNLSVMWIMTHMAWLSYVPVSNIHCNIMCWHYHWYCGTEQNSFKLTTVSVYAVGCLHCWFSRTARATSTLKIWLQ